MKKLYLSTLAGLALQVAAIQAQATTITYALSDLGGGTWQYDYRVINDTPVVPLEEFTIYFDENLYDSLVAGTAPADWDPLVVQPGTFVGLNDGFYDAYSMAGGLGAGESAGLFSVQFAWLGQGDPGSQPFEIVDPIDFSTLDSGRTVLASVVPLPAAAWLFGAGILGLLGWTRSRARG